MGRKKAKVKQALPPIPSGYETLDMLWRDMSVDARDILARLPTDVAAEWATVEAVGDFIATVLSELAAQRRLAMTNASSVMRLTREREVRRLFLLGRAQARAIAAAMVTEIRLDFPHAAPEQVWLLLRDRLRKSMESLIHQPQGVHALEGAAP
jgi:hypothetical protein